MTSHEINTSPHLTKVKERAVKHKKISSFSELEELYTLEEELGRGTFGVVMAATEKQTHKVWAVKIMSKTAVGIQMQLLQREISILKMINHPHIINLDKVFECSKKIYLVFERCFGELYAVYKEKAPFSEPVARMLVKDLASALEYLHYNDVVHRDLKLENILLANDPRRSNDMFVKVSDFGLSVVKRGFGIDNMLHDFCGTPNYMSPEMIGYKSYSHQTDIWSLGIIMYMFLGARFPFKAKIEKDLHNLICHAEPAFSNFPASPEAIDLIKKMLTKNPALRITAVEVRQHPWIHGKALDATKSSNILDMMKEWRTELMVEVPSEECDWTSLDGMSIGRNSDSKSLKREKQKSNQSNIAGTSMQNKSKVLK